MAWFANKWGHNNVLVKKSSGVVHPEYGNVHHLKVVNSHTTHGCVVPSVIYIQAILPALIQVKQLEAPANKTCCPSVPLGCYW